MQTTLTSPPTPIKLSPRDQWTVTGLCLGPMLIAITVGHVRPERGLLDIVVSVFPFIGAILLCHGLTALYTRQTCLLARLDALEKQQPPTRQPPVPE